LSTDPNCQDLERKLKFYSIQYQNYALTTEQEVFKDCLPPWERLFLLIFKWEFSSYSSSVGGVAECLGAAFSF